MQAQDPGLSLAGKVAVVTGGAKGIGSGIAEALARAGALVVVADIDKPGAELGAERLRREGLGADAVALDLAEEQSIVAAVETVARRHGAPWILVNNAGMQTRELLLEGTAAHWERTHAVNARGPFLLTREIARSMVGAGNGGRIVNIASQAVWGGIIQGLGVYTASKGALLGLNLASAFELVEHGITVNAVLPGGVVTPGSMDAAQGPPAEGPARRRPPLGMCEPADIAAAVLFFASPAARRITNQVIAVDAGWSVT